MYGFLKDHRQAWAREEIGAAVGSGQAPLTRALLFKQLHSYLSRDDPEGSAAVGGGVRQIGYSPQHTHKHMCTLQLWNCQPQLHDKQPANQITGENNGAWMPSSISTGCWGHTDVVLLKMWEIVEGVGLLYLLAAYVCSIKVRHSNEFQWLWRVIWQCRGTPRVRHVQQTATYCALSGLTSQTVTANVVTKRHQCPSRKYTEHNSIKHKTVIFCTD